MKILFVTSQFRIFEDIDCGASIRSRAFVKALAQIGQVDVISFVNDCTTSNIPNCHVVYSNALNESISTPSTIQKIYRHINFKNPYSFYPIHQQKKQIIDQFCQEKDYDIIACRYIGEAVSCGLLYYSNKLYIDVDDNPVSTMKQQLYIANLPHPWSKYSIKFRTYAIGVMVKNILSRVKGSFYSNPEDSPFRSSIYLPNLSSCSSDFTPITSKTPKRLLIVGWLDYPPNKLGIYHFVSKIFQEIWEKDNSIELYIAGNTKDDSFLRYLNHQPGVRALGYVDDIQALYKECRLVVIPIYHGAGTSVKFVEALAMGKVALSSSMGVRGFNKLCKEGMDYLLAKTDTEFIEKILAFIDSTEQLNLIAERGYKLINENFSFDRFAGIINETLFKK